MAPRVAFATFTHGARHNLVEFGYKDLTQETVEEETRKLLRGEKPTNIIGMMIEPMMKDIEIEEEV